MSRRLGFLLSNRHLKAELLKTADQAIPYTLGVSVVEIIATQLQILRATTNDVVGKMISNLRAPPGLKHQIEKRPRRRPLSSLRSRQFSSFVATGPNHGPA